MSSTLQWIGSDPGEALLQLRKVSLSATLCLPLQTPFQGGNAEA